MGSIHCTKPGPDPDPDPDHESGPCPDPEPLPSSPSQVFRDVYKPKSARALLEAELGLEISDDAVKVRIAIDP